MVLYFVGTATRLPPYTCLLLGPAFVSGVAEEKCIHSQGPSRKEYYLFKIGGSGQQWLLESLVY